MSSSIYRPLVAQKDHLFRMQQSKLTVPRVKVMLGGRFMLNDRTEHSGAINEASAHIVRISSKTIPSQEEKVVGYFFRIGRIEGRAVEIGRDYFLLEVDATPIKRDSLADKFMWIANKGILGIPDERDHERIVPNETNVRVRRVYEPENVAVSAIVIDISPSGAAISIKGSFRSEEKLIVGKRLAVVRRVFDEGIAVEFDERIPDRLFSPSIEL